MCKKRGDVPFPGLSPGLAGLNLSAKVRRLSFYTPFDPSSGWLPGEHLVQHAPESVDIRARVYVTVTRGLFRTHIVRCAEAEARLGDASCARLCHGERDAEVRDEGLARSLRRMLPGLMSRCTTPCSWA